MKKFGKILIIVLSLVVALSAFAIASSANSSPFLVEGLYRDSWEEAIENAYIKGDRIVPVELLGDYEADGESVEITESVVVSLNGHTLKSESGAPLFSVSGKDTTLTIVGPGTISCAGTLVEVQSGTLVLDASNGLNLISSGSDSFVVAGGEEKATVSVAGNVSFESSSANLFELASGAEFKLSANCGITAKPSASATDSFAIALVNSGAKVNVTGGTLANEGGYIFKIGDDTEEDSPVSISCESALLISDSASYGSIVEAGSAYANVDVRYCEISAAGGAFSADNTIADYEGEGRDKVYAKPTLKVNFIASTYAISDGSANANASLFCGNITGIVIASKIWNTDSSEIAINTRLWDGECGIILKKGTMLSVTKEAVVSDNKEPLKDEDGVTVYFNPNGTTNNNFSLEIIDGVACELRKATEITAENELVTAMVVTDDVVFFVDTEFSSNFNDPAGINPTTNAITASYGAITFENMADADGADNRFFKWEYDKNKKDQYAFSSGNSYMELDAGDGGAKRGWNGLHKNAYITWDFDIATSNGVYSYAGLKLFAREGTSSYAYTDNFGTISGNKFTVGSSNGYDLPTTPYVWTHITLVFEIDSSGSYEEGGKTIYPNLKNSMIHFYANGEYRSSTKLFNANISSAEGLKRSSEFSLDAIRFGLSGGTAVNKEISTSLLFDNNIVTYYPLGYEGSVSESDRETFDVKAEEYYKYKQDCIRQNIPVDKTIQDFVGDIKVTLGDALINKYAISLKDVQDVVYKKGYRMPGTGPVDVDDTPAKVVVDGVKYYDVDEALSAITDNSVVYIYTDVESQYNAKTNFTVYTKKEGGGNYKFSVVSDSYYLSDIRENGVVVGYKTLLANSFINIYWQINTGYKTEVPLGIIPSYDWIAPSPYYDELGRYIELLGWSTDRNATVPDEMLQITEEDLIKGYRIYYPVIGPSRVPVTFLDSNGKPVLDENGKPVVKEVPVGASETELKYLFDGSFFPAKTVEGNDWYENVFSGWNIDGDIVGLYPVSATPEFNDIRIKPSAIKTSFTVARLVDFVPSIYVLKPDENSLLGSDIGKVVFKGFSFDGKLLLQGSTDWNNQYVYNDVKIGENVYHKLNLATTHNYGKPTSEILEDFPVYIHYIYNDVEKVECINISFASYLEAVLANSNVDENASDEVKAKAEADKHAMFELMRFVMTYAEMADKKDSNVYAACSKYLKVEDGEYVARDSENEKYLSDYTKVMDKVSADKKKANKTLVKDINANFELVKWDFVTNTISFTPLESKYPKLSNAWTVEDPEKDGKMVYLRAWGSQADEARLGNGLSGRTFNFTFSFSSSSGYKTAMITAYDPETKTSKHPLDSMTVYIYNESTLDKRASTCFTGYYNLTAHIGALEERIANGEKGVGAELKMAQIILSTHFAFENCTTESGADIVGATNIPAAPLPKR